MTITIAPDALLELAFAWLDRDRAREAAKQARAELDQADSRIEEIRDKGPWPSTNEAVLEVGREVGSQLNRDQPADWEDFGWVFGQLEAIRTAEAERESLAAALAAAEAKAGRTERMVEARTEVICQPARDSLWQAEQDHEAADQAVDRARARLDQAKTEAAALVEQVWQIRQAAGQDRPTDDSRLQGFLDRTRDEDATIQTLLNQAREIVDSAETELEQARETASEAFHRLSAARNQSDEAEREVQSQLSDTLSVLQFRLELVTA